MIELMIYGGFMKRNYAYRRRAERNAAARAEYPVGTRVKLIHIDDENRKTPENLRGTVKGIDELGIVHVLWDNGRNFGVISDIDDFRKLTPEELKAEATKTA